MRRLVAATLVAAFALVLAGCGGGGDEGAVVEPTPVEASQPASLPVVTEIPDRSAPESSAVFEPFPTGSHVPEKLAETVADGQPTLILFVDGAQKVTNEVRSAVDKAVDEYSGVVDLFVYDLGKYTTTDANGIAVVDAEALQEDETASQAVTLAQKLEVAGLPYIVMTDDQGYLVFRHRDLVDSDYLLMHMERLTD